LDGFAISEIRTLVLLMKFYDFAKASRSGGGGPETLSLIGPRGSRDPLDKALPRLPPTQAMVDHPTASWDAMQDGKAFYRRQQVYNISNKLPRLDDFVVAGCKYGGPLGMVCSSGVPQSSPTPPVYSHLVVL